MTAARASVRAGLRALALLAALTGCGVKAPPRPPLPANPKAAADTPSTTAAPAPAAGDCPDCPAPAPEQPR